MRHANGMQTDATDGNVELERFAFRLCSAWARSDTQDACGPFVPQRFVKTRGGTVVPYSTDYWLQDVHRFWQDAELIASGIGASRWLATSRMMRPEISSRS